MQYQVLPSFIFGFLLTVFPRWLSLPALTPRHYLPVGIGLLGGQLLTLAGLAGNLPLLRAGALFTLVRLGHRHVLAGAAAGASPVGDRR